MGMSVSPGGSPLRLRDGARPRPPIHPGRTIDQDNVTVCRRSGGFTDDLALLHDTLVAVHEVLHAILAIKPIVGEESQDRIGPSPGPESRGWNEINRLADAKAVRGHLRLSEAAASGFDLPDSQTDPDEFTGHSALRLSRWDSVASCEPTMRNSHGV